MNEADIGLGLTNSYEIVVGITDYQGCNGAPALNSFDVSYIVIGESTDDHENKTIALNASPKNIDIGDNVFTFSFTIDVTNDSDSELNETMQIIITGVSNSTGPNDVVLGNNVHTMTIVSDD